LRVSASGLTAQRTRLDTIASNLANATTTRTPEGGPYRRREVVFTPQAEGAEPGAESGVTVTEIREDARQPQMVYDPAHPDANPDGYVAMPNVSVLEEMVDLISASRAYEANVTAMNVEKGMMQKALDIGRG
jgi:flagellar basal-body rod protein FlgC